MSDSPHECTGTESTEVAARTMFSQRWWIVGVVLLGIVVSALLYQTLRAQENRHIRDDFRHRAADRMKSITNEFRSGMILVRAAAAYMQSSAKVDQTRFAAITHGLLEEQNLIHALSWNPRVSAQDLQEHIAASRSRYPEYSVQQMGEDGLVEAIDLQSPDLSTPDDLFVVQLIEPFEPNRSAVGLDIASEGMRRTALYRACDLGQLTASEGIRLVQEPGSQFGTLLIAPVYQEGAGAEPGNNRRDHVRGVVVGVYRIGAAVEKALQILEPAGVDVHLFDESTSQQKQLLYAHSSRLLDQPMKPVRTPARLQMRDVCESSVFDFGGRHWALYCTPSADYFTSRQSWLPLTILGGGLFVTFLIAGYLHSQSRLTALLKQREQQLRRTVNKLTSAEERERRRVSYILHDELSPLLAVCQMKISTFEKQLSQKDSKILTDVMAHLGDCSNQARSLAVEMSPPVLYELGLEPAIEWLAERFEDQHGIHCVIRSLSDSAPIDDNIHVPLFQSVRELLNNVARHAQADQVEVIIDCRADSVTVSVCDNGIGFDPADRSPEVIKTQGFGLFGIRDRIESFGGQVDVKSTPGAGTRIRLRLPVETSSTFDSKSA